MGDKAGEEKKGGLSVVRMGEGASGGRPDGAKGVAQAGGGGPCRKGWEAEEAQVEERC